MMQDYNIMMLDDARLQHDDARWCKITTCKITRWWCGLLGDDAGLLEDDTRWCKDDIRWYILQSFLPLLS